MKGNNSKYMHRTIKPSKNIEFKKELSTGRCVPSGNDINSSYEVHYEFENKEYIVTPPGKDNSVVGGLSLFKHNSQYEIVDDNWGNTEDKVKIKNKIGKIKKFPRYFCYKIKNDLGGVLPEKYSIEEKLNRKGYFLHPKQTIYLQDFEEKGDLPNQGQFPELDNLEWEKCCTFYRPDEETYKWLKANGSEPSFDKHDDPECEVLLSSLNEALPLFDYNDLDDVYEAMNLIQNSIEFDGLKSLSLDQIRLISFSMEELMNNCHPDDSEEIHLVWLKFSKYENTPINQTELLAPL